MTVKKGQSPFLTKGLQSAARIICSLKAIKFHTCRLRSVFATYTPNGSPLGGRRRKKRTKLALPPAGGKLCEAFFDKLRAVS